jgi:antitoxin FitA
MAEVLVRDLDASVVEKLKARAAANGRSLQAELKAVLEAQARRVTKVEARMLAARIRRRIGARPQTDSGMLQARPRAMTPNVVDASVVIKWFVDEVHAEAARRLPEDQYELFAPDLLWLEYGNILWKKSATWGAYPRRGPPHLGRSGATADQYLSVSPCTRARFGGSFRRQPYAV